jgi:integrase
VMPNYKGRRKGTRRIVIWAQGKSHEWIVEGTKADGDAFEARKRVELEAGTLSTRSAPAFLDFCSLQYRPHAEANLKASTWKNVRIYQVTTLAEFFGAMKLTEIDDNAIELYKAERRQKVKPSSVNNELRVLKTILAYARKLGYPCASPAVSKMKVRGDGRVRVWTMTQLEDLFTRARDVSPGLLRLLVFLLNTGCRKGEALACEWDWIDFDAAMIRIPSNEFWQPKNGKPREVPMSDACRSVLTGVREHARWVFPSTLGERYSVFPKGLFNEARQKAHLTGGVHTLRHTFASNFLQQVPDLFLLAQVLGHSHTRVTELYAHLLPGHLDRARNAVNIGPALSANHGGRRGERRASARNRSKRP